MNRVDTLSRRDQPDGAGGTGPIGGVTQLSLDKQFRLQNGAVNRCLDTICQEIKGGGASPSGESGSLGGRQPLIGPKFTSPWTPTSVSGE